MKYRMKPLMVVGAGLCLFASPASAGEAFVSAGKLSVQSTASSLFNVTLSVSGPDGYSAQEHSSFGTPSVALNAYNGMADGVYTWQLTGATTQRVRNPKAGFNNGRGELGPEYINKPYSESGSFRVVNGVVQMPNAQLESDFDGGAK